MGRVGKVEDIAKPVVFLCTDDAAFITGQNIFITGGQTEYIPMPRSDFARK
jgi:NAD(P)-dependent dehydrogenase (short-subunit alcohol dehydrogenase family)